MAKSSGIDALLEALRQSGFDAGSAQGAGGSSPFTVDAEDASSERGAGASGSRGGVGGFGNGFGGFGGAGGRGGSGGQEPHIDLSFLDNLKGISKKMLVVLAIVLILVLAAAYWWFHPPINIHSVDKIGRASCRERV